MTDARPRARDRRSAERPDIDLGLLLRTPGTRVLEVRGDHFPVDLSHGADHPSLQWRDAEPADVDADVVLFLDRHVDGESSVAVAHRPEKMRLDAEPPVSWMTLREVGPWLPQDDLHAAMTAQGMAVWHRTHAFCSRCGAPTSARYAGWVRTCEAENRELYPRTDPAVIMGIRDAQDRILLARNPAWPEGRRSVLAGFVEPGESLEDAVRREVAEEVGVVVERVEYAGSQPWPFPASLMVGFDGWATTTDLALAEDEIAEAEWFTREELRAAVEAERIMLPGRMSIARRLVERWYGGPLDVPSVDRPGGPSWHKAT